MNNKDVENKRILVGTRKRKLPGRDSTPERITSTRQDDVTLDQALEVFVDAKKVERVRDTTISGYYEHINYLSDYMSEKEGIAKPFSDELSASLIRIY